MEDNIIYANLCAIWFISWIYIHWLWVLVAADFILVTFFILLSLCFIWFFLLHCTRTFSTHGKLLRCWEVIQAIIGKSYRVPDEVQWSSLPVIFFHLSPRTLPTSVNAIPGLVFFTVVFGWQHLDLDLDLDLDIQNMGIFFPFLLCFSNNTKFKIRKLQYININIKS